MQHKWRNLPKLIAMIGGLLILIGIVLLGMSILSLFGFFDVGVLLERKYLLMFAIAMVVVGLLDAFSAVIIARW